jgi:carbamoyl-phosphate synthase large subunit
MAPDPSYIDAVKAVIVNEKIDVVLIGTDVELPVLSVHRAEIEDETGCRIVVASSEVVAIANDKWLTAEFLRKNNFPYAKSALTTDKAGIALLQQNVPFPLLAKPVDGARSKGVVIIRNCAELDAVCSYQNNLVVQEFLPEENGEFTSGCLVFDGVCKAIVTLRRDLRDGNTSRTFRDATTSKYDPVLVKIAEKLGVAGPCNFQFRVKNGLPIIFEINGRFSGTTPLRLLYGFNEVAACIDHIMKHKEIALPELKTGVVMRVFSDIMVDNKEIAAFTASRVLDNPHSRNFDYIP